MKRFVALLCAALLACLCFACGATPVNPGTETTHVTKQAYTYTRSDGVGLPGVYTGYMAGGKPEDSNGAFEGDNGDTYVGGWENGQLNGQGAYTWASGAKYTGECKDGRRDGRGTYISPNGNIYDGEWREDKREGQGTMTWAEGDSYAGAWKNDVQEGQGTLTWADGSKYAGE